MCPGGNLGMKLDTSAENCSYELVSIYEIRPREKGQGVGLTDTLGRHADLWFRNAETAMEYAVFSARRDGGTIRVYGSSGMIQLEREVGQEGRLQGPGLFEASTGGQIPARSS